MTQAHWVVSYILWYSIESSRVKQATYELDHDAMKTVQYALHFHVILLIPIKMSSSAWSKQHAVALINTPFRAFACHTVIQAIQATQATQAIQAIQATQAIMILPWSLYWSDDRTERLLAKWYRIW